MAGPWVEVLANAASDLKGLDRARNLPRRRARVTDRTTDGVKLSGCAEALQRLLIRGRSLTSGFVGRSA